MVANTGANGGGDDVLMMDGEDSAEWNIYGEDGELVEPPHNGSNRAWARYALE